MLIFIDWFNRVWKMAPNAIEAELRQASPDTARVDALASEMAAALDLFESLLTGREFLLGYRFSAADCAVFPFAGLALGRPPGDDGAVPRDPRAPPASGPRPPPRGRVDRPDGRLPAGVTEAV